MQEEVQYQAVEDVHRLFQLFAHRCHNRREDFHNARRTESGSKFHGADTTCHEANRCMFPSNLTRSDAVLFDSLSVRPSTDLYRFLIAVSSAICYGQIPTKTLPAGVKTIAAYHSRLVPM